MQNSNDMINENLLNQDENNKNETINKYDKKQRVSAQEIRNKLNELAEPIKVEIESTIKNTKPNEKFKKLTHGRKISNFEVSDDSQVSVNSSLFLFSKSIF